MYRDSILTVLSHYFCVTLYNRFDTPRDYRPFTFLGVQEVLVDPVGLAYHYIPLVLRILEDQEGLCILVVLGIPEVVGVVRRVDGCLELVVEV